MRLCISQATTLSTSFEDDLVAYSQAGWSAVELWLTKLETYLESHSIQDVSELLAAYEIEAVAASFQGGLLVSQGAARDAHWTHFRCRLDILESLNVRVLIIAPDFVSEPSDDDLSRAASSLAAASELAGKHGVRLAVEFQKNARFCASLDTAIALIGQCGAEPSTLGVCLDLFHYYTGPSKFEDMAYLSSENLAWVQLCDLSGVPREVARDADRIFPGEGDFQIEPILQHLERIGYDGYLSLEVLNPRLWSIAPSAVADAGLRAMARFLGTAKPGVARGVACP